MNNLVSLEPKQFPAYVDAIESAGGTVAPLTGEVRALVWTDYSDPDGLTRAIQENPQLEWVQLPFAGVDAFEEILQLPVRFTSAKRSYSEPVAEHALMLCMALGRAIPERIRAKSWGKKFAVSLFDAEVLIVGGGGIAQQLVDLLVPYRSKVTIIRKRPDQDFSGNSNVVIHGFNRLDELLPKAQFVVLACALTDETRFLFDSRRFSLLNPDAYLVNVARGEVVDQEALVEALEVGKLAGAATDVTYPEPLPEGHPMWRQENLIITPHTADTKPMVTRLFATRLRENVSAWLSGDPLVGQVDPTLGY
ncbi:hydroxyacid dehydrogenase [Aquiluna borgnonia]|uniref:Hydroxyacid dehydrogenase n=1 Tax=Aquiluna borgnonia TaxID=2499157 RepID=A0A7D4QNB9_9MICO|nr:D-isomer specific 2-hydroxyacid dehydrogenase family protein [Aquiluna borgnonia]QKJ25587.1 hydroxyacid dehydrogenase [Aquiluna borgnonia]